MGSSSDSSELEFTNSSKRDKKKYKGKNKKDKITNNNGDPDPTEEEPGTLKDSADDYASSSDDTDTGLGGRRALGLDPEDLMDYDGSSAPMNGSQYLMAVMKERGVTPKIAVSKDKKVKPEGEEFLSLMEKKKKNKSLEHFTTAKRGENDPCEDILKKYGPTQSWRSENLRNFSMLRSKVEGWRELLSKKVTRLKTENVKFPDTGNKALWLRFCYGIQFERLIASRTGPSLSVAETLRDYIKDLKHNNGGEFGSIIKKKQPLEDEEDPYSSSSCPLSPRSITTTQEAAGGGGAVVETENHTHHQPLMSLMLVLSQYQIERLILYNSHWISRVGLVNKAQGEWLYALLACVDKPIEPNTMADIRSICKSLITQRRKFCERLELEKVLTPPPPSSESPLLKEEEADMVDKLSDDFKKDLSFDQNNVDEYLSAINLIIYLIVDYFLQRDLLDEL